MTIYIHIPYCKFICEMCPFTHEPLKGNKMDEYVDSIIKEIEFYSHHRLSHELQVNSIYFGGGTASLLKPYHVKKILNKLYEKFKIKQGIQITLECHPRTVDEEYLKLIKESGINRVSFGIQSFNQDNLNKLKLHQKVPQSIRIIKYALDLGFDTVSSDIMYNFPGQSLENLEKDLDTAIDLGIHNLSLYAIDPEVRGLEDFKSKQNAVNYEKQMFDLIYLKLNQKGFTQIVQPDYCKEGHFNNQIIDLWGAPQSQNLGFGAGAFSESFNGYTWANIHDPDLYITTVNSGKIPMLMGQKWSKDDEISRFPALGVRCLKFNMSVFNELFHMDFLEVFKYEVKLLKEYQYIEFSGDELIITQNGKFYIDNISKMFFNLSNRGKNQLWGCNLRNVRQENDYIMSDAIERNEYYE